MVSESGFKECPRCGLRNSRSALNCKFCSYEFDEVREEWNEYLEVLEALTQEDEMEEEDSTRIKATFVKPEELEIEEPVPVEEVPEVEGAIEESAATSDEPVEAPEGVALEEETIGEGIESETEVPSEEMAGAEEEVEAGVEEVLDETEEPVQEEMGGVVEEIPVVEEDSDQGAQMEVTGVVPGAETTAEAEVVEVDTEMREPTIEEHPGGVTSEGSAVDEPVSTAGRLKRPFAYLLGEGSGFVGTIFFITGIVVYLAALITGFLGDLGSLVGWILSIVGALGLIIGLNGIYNNWVPSK